MVPTAFMLCVHAGGVLVGLLMVNNGNPLALQYRDQLIARAQSQDPASLALASGNRLQAAAWDFSRNLLLGAVPSTVTGLAIGIPYLIAIHRGWVGGIVSVDGSHISRLSDPIERRYYLLTLVLQLIPYSLAGGAGVRLGLSYLRRHKSQEPTWIGLPKEALRDVLLVYILVVPLFAVASLWEYLAR